MRSCSERANILAFFVPLRLSSVSMAEAPVAILPYVLEAVRPAAIPPSSYLRLDFMAGIFLHFIFLACVASTCFIAYVAFSCYGMCRLHVGFSRRVSPSSYPFLA